MSSTSRSRESEDRRDRKRRKESKQDVEKLKKQAKKLNQEVQKLKHVETFYEKPPPGLIKEEVYKPEDCIPADPGNEDARDFLAHAPTKGLWMPLGKEVKVMQCWRCKRYGHRTGDRECPFFIKGNQKLEQFRVVSVIHRFVFSPIENNPFDRTTQSCPGLLPLAQTDDRVEASVFLLCRQEHAHEDPMYDLIRENKRNEKETRIQQLQQLLQDTTSSDSESSSSSSSTGDRKKRKHKKKEKKGKEKKKRKKKRKHKSSKTSDCSESD
uniref:RP9 pre-mRNA splicing factor n=1 Tax=Esox lucius TaxID=8010 RepID=A0A3P9AIT4_ESOLU